MMEKITKNWKRQKQNSTNSSPLSSTPNQSRFNPSNQSRFESIDQSQQPICNKPIHHFRHKPEPHHHHHESKKITTEFKKETHQPIQDPVKKNLTPKSYLQIETKIQIEIQENPNTFKPKSKFKPKSLLFSLSNTHKIPRKSTQYATKTLTPKSYLKLKPKSKSKYKSNPNLRKSKPNLEIPIKPRN